MSDLIRSVHQYCSGKGMRNIITTGRVQPFVKKAQHALVAIETMVPEVGQTAGKTSKGIAQTQDIEEDTQFVKQARELRSESYFSCDNS